MKFNSVVTNIEQDFTASEKALGRKNIDAGGLGKYEIDDVEQRSGDLVLGQRTGSSMREIGVKLRDAVSGDYKVGYLVPPRAFKGMNLVCDESGNITWGVQPPQLKSGNYTWIDDHYHINVSGLQEHLTFEYTEDQKISGVNGSAINGGEPITYQAGEYINITDDNVINVTGVQPSGDYALASDLSAYALESDLSAYVDHSELSAYATHEEVTSATSGKLDASAYHEYSAGQYLSLNDYLFSVTGLQPSGDYALASDLSAYAQITDLSAYATHEEVTSATSGKLDSSAYTAPVQSDWNQNDDDALDYIKNKPAIPSLEGYATEEYVNSAVSGKLDSSAYHEYSAGQYLSLNDYLFSVTGVQPELDFDFTDAGKISAINGSAVYGSEEGATYTEGQFIEITDQNQINVTGTSALIAGENITISATNSGYRISSVGGSGGSDLVAGEYIDIDANDIISVTGCLPLSAYTEPVQSDWIEDDNTLQSYIQNKPVEIGLVAGSGVWFEDMTSAVKINCSAAGGLDYAVSGISGVSGIFIEDAGDHVNIGYSGSVGSGNSYSTIVHVTNTLPPVSTDVTKMTVFADGRTRFDSLFNGVIPSEPSQAESGSVLVANYAGSPAKGTSQWKDVHNIGLREVPAYTSATNGKILGVQDNMLTWVNNPVKIVSDSADIPASGSSDNILYVIAAN